MNAYLENKLEKTADERWWSAVWPALVADVAAVIALILFFSDLTAWVAARPWAVSSLLMAVYAAAAFAFNALKRLVPADADEHWLTKLDFTRSPRLKGGLGLVMVIFFVLVQAWLNGLVDDTQTLYNRPGYVHEGEISLYYLLGPTFMWIIVGLLYQLAFYMPTEKRIERGTSRYWLTQLVGIGLLNGVLVIYAAVLHVLLDEWRPFSLPAMAGVFVGTAVLLELLFDPPRLRHALKNPRQWWPLLTYAGLLVYAAVRITAG